MTGIELLPQGHSLGFRFHSFSANSLILTAVVTFVNLHLVVTFSFFFFGGRVDGRGFETGFCCVVRAGVELTV